MDQPAPEIPLDQASTQRLSDHVRRAVAGDPGALDRLVEWLSPLMLAWARSQVRPGVAWAVHPEDLVQDVWVRVLPRLEALRPHDGAGGRMTPALVGLVKQTLRNRVIDVRRQATRRRLQALPTVSDSGRQPANPSSGPFSKALRSERRRLLQDALDRLPERDRALYTRRIFEDAGLDELAAEFGMSRDAVIKARQRVRRRLSQFLAPHVLDQLEPA